MIYLFKMVIFHSKLLVYQRVVAMDISIAGWTWLTTAVVWEAPAKLEVGKRPRGVRALGEMTHTHTEKQILLTLKTCCGLYGNLDLWNQEIWNQPIDPQNSWENGTAFGFGARKLCCMVLDHSIACGASSSLIFFTHINRCSATQGVIHCYSA